MGTTSYPFKCFLTAAAALALAVSSPSRAQDGYPSKAITFIVPYAAGGSSDTRARQLAQKLGERLHVPVVVENKPGASGNIGTAQLARANPDGYTIGLGNFAPLSVNKALYGANLGFDPDKDIAPIVLIERGAMVLGVNRQSPYRDVAALVKAGRANPDTLNYASTGAGGASHLVTELFKDSAGLTATHVPYRGGAPAVSADTRLPALPDVPTFKELGMADMVASNWFGVIAPAGTPDAVVRALNENINRVLEDPGYRAIVASQGAEVAGGSPADFKAFIAGESARWAGLTREKHITIQ